MGYVLPRLKKTAFLLLLLFYTEAVFSIMPFIITDIRVEGIERLDAGTVFNYLPLKVGDEVNDQEARISIKELFNTGFFKDVALEQDGTVLVVKLVERPSIAEITFSGNKALTTETLEQGLEQIGLLEGRIFNSIKLAQVEREIKATYLSLGRYSATVNATATELDRNRVAIELNIDEGRVATIKKINIIGATIVPVKALIDEMSQRDKRGFNLFSKRNQYSKQKLEADIETIRSYYLNRGFHDFKVVSRNVQISPNKQNIFISIVLDEGPQYVFGESVFKVVGDIKIEGVEDQITIEAGQPFSRKVVNASRIAITDHYSDVGYAFVDVKPSYEADREAGEVKTIFTIVPKQRVYVRKINITGNLHTRDQVIRRELRQFEGAWYSARAISLSRARLQRLGYFENVKIETPEVPGAEDQVDMRVIVNERNTGAFTFSLGYSDTDGGLLGASFSQRNLFGTGREINLALNTSDASNTLSLNYINPYHTPDGVSRGLTIARRKVETEEVNSAEYVVNTLLFGVNYKIPITETNSFNLGFSLEEVDLGITASTPVEFRKVTDSKATGGNDKEDGVNLLMSLGLSKDTRDDFFFPTNGSSSSVSMEISAPGSEYEYYKLNLQGTYYTPISSLFTLKGGFGLGYGDSFGNSKDGLPFFRRYYAGGSNSVRGYDGRSLGPLSSGRANCTPNEAKDITKCTPVTPRSVGGDQRILLNAEVLFSPFGGDGGNDKRMGLFIDGGTVFGKGYERHEGDTPVRKIEDTSIDLANLRYSVGFVFNWFSPIGPFAISYAEPLNDQSGDNFEKFQITVGSVFQ